MTGPLTNLFKIGYVNEKRQIKVKELEVKWKGL